MKLAINNQYSVGYIIVLVVGTEFGVIRKNGKRNRIKIAHNILITPPSLLGQARKIA